MRVHPLACGLGYAFLIETPQGMFLFDSGSPKEQDRVLRKIKELRRTDLKLIWISHAHYDHYGSAAILRELTGAPIGVHPADAESLTSGQSPLGTARKQGILFHLLQSWMNHIRPLPPTTPDFTLEDGEKLERFGLEASILHTPGHTPGHTCLLLPGGVALAGDLIGRSPKLGLQSLVATNWEQLPGSLARLKAAQPDIVYSGHSPRPVTGSKLQKINP